MRKIFIDAGAYTGDTIDKFLEEISDAQEYGIYAFEPSPENLIKLRDTGGKSIIIYEIAVWIEDGVADFYLGRNPVASTLIKTKETGHIDLEKPIRVSTIDFSKWVIRTFNKRDDYIILKMDIEGAEYKVLNKMIDDGSINYINELWAEYHGRKISDISSDDTRKLKQKLRTYKHLITKDLKH